MKKGPIHTLCAVAAALLALPAIAGDSPNVTAGDFAGLWEARRYFGPEVRGELVLTREGDVWTAEIGAHRVRATVEGCWISFVVPGDRGSFRGCLEAGDLEAGGLETGGLETGGPVVGHWTQPRTAHAGLEAASPVVLERVGRHRWVGEVEPFEDGFSFYLPISAADDGTARAFLRNPERNLGIFARAERIEIEGDELRLIGHWFGRGDETVLTRGPYSSDADWFSLSLRGATYDFHRVDDDPASAFYARGTEPEPWRYRAPPALDDGWEVASLHEAGMSDGPIRALIEEVIDRPADSVHAPYIHGLLIARRGKLVVEEYFHGFHRDMSHDTRSASKSLTSFLIGAAIEAGEPVSLATPVYETIGGRYHHDALDPRAARMTLENLLTMTSGLDCDDRDPESPGGEDRMQSQQENLDWYDYTLSLDMIREPGETAVYCSINPNLAGLVLSAATGNSLETLFQRLVAEPLDIDRYHLYLQPTGEPYMGGGIHWMPRDFLKLGQVMLDGGTWNGRRVLAEDFAARSVEPLYELRERGYGYLWWVTDLPWADGTVKAFFAGGNGGQVVMGIPELELLVSVFAGNYSDRVMYRIQEELVPEYILEAVR